MLDKNGQPYTPMTEAEMRAHRNRPYPESFTRTSQMLAERERQRAKEPERAYHHEDARSAPEPMAVAIARKVKTTRKVRRG